MTNKTSDTKCFYIFTCRMKYINSHITIDYINFFMFLKQVLVQLELWLNIAKILEQYGKFLIDRFIYIILQIG